MALTAKKLDKIQKTLTDVYGDDPETLAGIVVKLDGVRAAVTSGETVTKSDLQDILGEVEIVAKTTETPAAEDMAHPMQGPTLELFKSIFDESGAIKKGMTVARGQELFEKFYETIAKEFDAGLEAAVEETALQLGGGSAVDFGKKGKGKPADGDGDEDDETMTKFLKSAPGQQILGAIEKLSKQVETLASERDHAVFAKQAEDIGEGEGFADDLALIHKTNPALADRLKKRLGAKNTLLKQNQLWGAEIGAGGTADGDSTAEARLNGFAKEKVSKGEKDDNGKKLTFAKAFTQVCQEQPDLYREYQDEKNARRR